MGSRGGGGFDVGGGLTVGFTGTIGFSVSVLGTGGQTRWKENIIGNEHVTLHHLKL